MHFCASVDFLRTFSDDIPKLVTKYSMKPNNNESTDGSTVGGDVLSHDLQSPVAVLVPQTTSTTRRAIGSRMIPRTLQ